MELYDIMKNISGINQEKSLIDSISNVKGIWKKKIIKFKNNLKKQRNFENWSFAFIFIFIYNH